MTKQKPWRDTVFHKQHKYSHVNEKIAVFYHRATVVMYSLFLAWGLVALKIDWPNFFTNEVTTFINLFAIATIPASALAAFGALYFPRLARLEMFAAGALCGLIIAFLSLVFWESYIQGSESASRSFWIDLTLIVIPLSRVLLIFGSLIRAADRKD